LRRADLVWERRPDQRERARPRRDALVTPQHPDAPLPRLTGRGRRRYERRLAQSLALRLAAPRMLGRQERRHGWRRQRWGRHLDDRLLGGRGRSRRNLDDRRFRRLLGGRRNAGKASHQEDGPGPTQREAIRTLLVSRWRHASAPSCAGRARNVPVAPALGKEPLTVGGLLQTNEQRCAAHARRCQRCQAEVKRASRLHGALPIRRITPRITPLLALPSARLRSSPVGVRKDASMKNGRAQVAALIALALGTSAGRAQSGGTPPPPAGPVADAPHSPNLWSFLCPTPEQVQACKEQVRDCPLGQLLISASKPLSLFTGGILDCGYPTPHRQAKSTEAVAALPPPAQDARPGQPRPPEVPDKPPARTLPAARPRALPPLWLTGRKERKTPDPLLADAERIFLEHRHKDGPAQQSANGGSDTRETPHGPPPAPAVLPTPTAGTASAQCAQVAEAVQQSCLARPEAQAGPSAPGAPAGLAPVSWEREVWQRVVNALRGAP
jgi:hypothetical protein